MVFPAKWWILWLALFLGAGPVWAAGPTKEQRAYDAAVLAFNDGLWPLAEVDFAQFALKYPESKHLPEAGLLQARAMLKQNKIILAMDLLQSHQPTAGVLQDDYTYWLGEAQFQSGDWRQAAATFVAIPRTSPLAFSATIEASAALAKLQEWPRLVALIEGAQPLFQAAEQVDANSELVLRGRLLLAQAEFAQGNYAGADQVLTSVKPGVLPADLEWQRLYLLCQVKQSAGDQAAALPLATDLVALARKDTGVSGAERLATSAALQAGVLERLDRGDDARMAWQINLATNAPEFRQREAILKIASLAIARREFTNAEPKLEDYAAQFASSPAIDAAWLTLGELYLQDYVTTPALTNRLADAQARFNLLITNRPNSAYIGKAYLDRGWTAWLAGDYAASQADFEKATLNLPPSDDLAVARFKMADAQFAQTNYAAALSNYQLVLAGITNDQSRAGGSLVNPALYQSFRAQLELSHLAEAANTMARLAAGYPQNALNETNVLLLGERYNDLQQPAKALAVFQSFTNRLPHSPLLPLVDLAIARAYEELPDWPAALAQYNQWIKAYPTNSLLPQALYSQAWATYQAGDDTNALVRFTNFVARFPTNELAPTAQWWVADHYYGMGDSPNAELNFKAIFQNPAWQTNLLLYYRAQLMAGSSAVLRTDDAGAIRDYYEKLEGDTNCPLDLRVQATFAHGRALMKMDSVDTNNPTANYQKAISIFNQICTYYPTNEEGARAWGEMGDCYLQVTNYEGATNAFTQALNAAGTNVSVTSQAKIGLAIVKQKQAALLPAGPDQSTLLYQALGDYLEVFYDQSPDRDAFWTKRAGLDAADLAAALGEWREVTNLYAILAVQLPEIKDSLAVKAAQATQHLKASGH